MDKISELQVPVVSHNGLLDVLHAYQGFVGDLPATAEMFAQQLSKLFPVILDTKFLLQQ